MSTRRVCIGIDFGTSNSSIAYVICDPRDRAAQKIPVSSVNVAVDEGGGAKSDRLPTILAESMDRKRSRAILGWEVFQQFFGRRKKGDLLRHGENFFRSVKSDLGTLRVYPHAFSSDYQTPEKVAAAIIKQLLDEAKKSLSGYDIFKSKVVISVPASLSTLGREHTLAAAAHAGLDPENVDLIDEPVAALLDFLNSGKAAGVLDSEKTKNVLVFDYGGGTLDLSLVRARFDSTNQNTGLRVLNLAISQYRRLGGDDIDRAVMDSVLWPQIEAVSGVSQEDTASDLRKRVNDTLTPTVARRLKEGICRKIADATRTSGRRSKRSFEFIEKLYVTFEGIELPRRFRITSDGFEKLMRPFLSIPEAGDDESDSHSLLQPILEVLERGGIKTSQLDALILHGGSCRNPLVRELLSEYVGNQTSLFGHAVIEDTPNLDTSVACGAALACYWHHERNAEIVTPIIADEIGIVTLNEKRVMLVDAGEDLPFPNEDEVHVVEADFYVPKSNLKQMLVPFYTGDQAHRISNSVSISLPPDTKRNTPVSIKLRVDRNKTLQWWCKIGDGPFIKVDSINNPWASEVPSRATKELYDHRRAMRDKLGQTGRIPDEMMLCEIMLLDRADRLDEAELLTRDMIRHSRLTAILANMLGLIAHKRRDLKAALHWHEKAAEISPGNAVLIGNYGCQLCACGRFAEAEAKMRAALAMNPTLSYLYVWLGNMYREQGDEPRARAEYTEALRLARQQLEGDRDSAETWLTIAMLHRNLGEYEKASEAQARASSLKKNEQLGGDHRSVIAGPDSGIMFSDEIL
ncbi:MAG: tetratricopeptide repeat protein [Deltaproteobacteria bacterium]|nr:tetratricopeptide repeat protein [Deltaproteobacteria bacterium]